MKKRILYKIIIIASLIGLILSFYLTYTHYANKSVVCINDEHIETCNNVLNGPYSVLFFTIPNALIGAIGFIIFLVLSYLGFKGKNVRNLMLILSSISFIFVLYLAYLVFFVISSFCIWCFIIWVLILIIFICSLLIKKE